LTGGARNLPPRQQALRKTIQWSYDLLSKEEQCLFRHLSVFVGGCTLEAVATVAQGYVDVARAGREIEVLEGATSLIDKSLLLQTEQEGEEPRLLMLETIREYGLEALTARGEMQTVRQAHALYYLHLAEEAEPRLMSAEQAQWLERLEQEHENLRDILPKLREYGILTENLDAPTYIKHMREEVSRQHSLFPLFFLAGAYTSKE